MDFDTDDLVSLKQDVVATIAFAAGLYMHINKVVVVLLKAAANVLLKLHDTIP